MRIRIYYRALSENGISSYYYKPTGTDQETVINELWAKLIKSDTEKARISLIPSDLKLVRFSVENSSLGLYFDSSYQNMDTVSELLFRAGIVRTFCQVEGQHRQLHLESVCAGWCSGYHSQSSLQDIQLCTGNQGRQQVHGIR